MKSSIRRQVLATGFACGLTFVPLVAQTPSATVDTHVAAARVAAAQDHLGLFNRLSVDSQIVGGLRKLGLDPTTIKYALVSHGHRDHSGGAQYLQDSFKTRVLLSAPDWDMLDKNMRDPAKPKRDLVVTDGQKLTLGNQTITLYVTPGHTPGTVSTLVPVFDGGVRHLATAWGGTAFNFQPSKERFQIDIDSARRFSDIVAKAGADVLISNHTIFDGSKTRLPAMATRTPGAPHPYVIGHRQRQAISQSGRGVCDGGNVAVAVRKARGLEALGLGTGFSHRLADCSSVQNVSTQASRSGQDRHPTSPIRSSDRGGVRLLAPALYCDSLLKITGGTQRLEAGCDIRTVQELRGYRDVSTTMTYLHVMQRGASGVKSPMDRL